MDEMQKHIMALLPSPIANNACVQSAIEDGEKSASQAEHCIGNAVANNMMDYKLVHVHLLAVLVAFSDRGRVDWISVDSPVLC